MAIAKRCDRCEKLYEEYNTKKSNTNINGIMTLNIDKHQKYFLSGPYDLCPDCSSEFMKWFENVPDTTQK